jgi:hypothetical protein
MYERPPPAEPDRSWSMRYLAVLPLGLATCSGCELLLIVMVELIRVDEGEAWFQLPQKLVVVAVISLITLISSLGAWQGRRRGWNPQLWLGLSGMSLIGFVALVLATGLL